MRIRSLGRPPALLEWLAATAVLGIPILAVAQPVVAWAAPQPDPLAEEPEAGEPATVEEPVGEEPVEEPIPEAPAEPIAPAPPPKPAAIEPVDAGAAAELDPAGDVEAEAETETDPLRFVAGQWWLRPFGFIRAGYENVEDDERYVFVGRNDGFVLDSARLGIDAGYAEVLGVRISFEGATKISGPPNTPSGTLDVKLKDAFGRFDPIRYAGLAFGQLSAPFAAEELRDRDELLFASRAVGQEGVLVGRGFEEEGVAVDRQIGMMLSPREPFYFGDIGLWYGLMLANGNGDNQLLDDNGEPAVYGRLELRYAEYVTLGGAFLVNSRREGALPNQFDENDTGVAVDLLVQVVGLEVFGQLVQVATSFPTVGVEDRTRRALSAQVGYRFEPPYVHITPAYRFAQYHPWADSSEETLEAFRLDYHTLGVRLEHAEVPLKLFVNYTFTVEPEPRQLDNNRFQLMAEAGF